MTTFVCDLYVYVKYDLWYKGAFIRTKVAKFLTQKQADAVTSKWPTLAGRELGFEYKNFRPATADEWENQKGFKFDHSQSNRETTTK